MNDYEKYSEDLEGLCAHSSRNLQLISIAHYRLLHLSDSDDLFAHVAVMMTVDRITALLLDVERMLDFAASNAGVAVDKVPCRAPVRAVSRCSETASCQKQDCQEGRENAQ